MSNINQISEGNLLSLPRTLLEDKLGQELTCLVISVKNITQNFLTQIEAICSEENFPLSEKAEKELIESKSPIFTMTIKNNKDIAFIVNKISSFIYTVLFEAKDKKSIKIEVNKAYSAIQKIPPTVKAEIIQVIIDKNKEYDSDQKVKFRILEIIGVVLGTDDPPITPEEPEPKPKKTIKTAPKEPKTVRVKSTPTIETVKTKMNPEKLNEFLTQYPLGYRLSIKKILRYACKNTNNIFLAEQLMNIFEKLVWPRFNKQKGFNYEKTLSIMNFENEDLREKADQYADRMLASLMEFESDGDPQTTFTRSAHKTPKAKVTELVKPEELNNLINTEWLKIIYTVMNKLTGPMYSDREKLQTQLGMIVYYCFIEEALTIGELSRLLQQNIGYVSTLRDHLEIAKKA